ncbi:hypothetical protein V8C35DRAFT_328701 [Trichoderma chlorosporum]
MPPTFEPRRRVKLEIDPLRPSSPRFVTSDEASGVPIPSVEDAMADPQPLHGKMPTPNNGEDEVEDVIYRPFNESQKSTSQRGKSTAAKPMNVSSPDVEVDNPYSAQYPLSRQVYDLEKKAQELQDKRDFFQNQCHEVTLTLERLTKATKKERSEHEEECKNLEAVIDALAKQLEEEKDKVRELQAKNEILDIDLVTTFYENTALSKMLEEKSYESWIFRCALAVVFKLAPSTRERVAMRKLISDVLAYLREKYQRERAAQEGDRAQDQNDSNRVSEEAAERSESSLWQEDRPSVSVDGELDSDSEDLPLRNRKARQKRPRVKDEMEDRASDEDSDDDQPLLHILKKRAKKLKMMPSREKSSTIC